MLTCFTCCRTAFDAASKHDQTQGLAAALGWIADNLTVFNVLLYIALITQVDSLSDHSYAAGSDLEST